MLPLATPVHPESASNLDPLPSAQLLFVGAFPHRGFCYFAGVVTQLLLVGAFPTGFFAISPVLLLGAFPHRVFCYFAYASSRVGCQFVPFRIPVVTA